MKRQGIVRVCKSAGTETWTGAATETPLFDRGFTGHEHLYAFGLINMNGRMYDPLMSSFLSVDAYVQSPDNAQNFNRYAYCLNNPLKYVDPSGWLMQGALMGNSSPESRKWSLGFKLHTVSDFNNAYYKVNMAMNGNMDGPCGDSPFGSGGMGDLINTYGYYATHHACSVYNCSSPLAQLQLILNWRDNPCMSTNRDLREAGITYLTVGEANLKDGTRNSFIEWTTSGITHTADIQNEFVGGNEYGCGAVSNCPLWLYDNPNFKIAAGMLNAMGLYSSIEASLTYNEILGFWRGKNGQFHSMHFNGNAFTGGKLKYARAISERFRRASGVLNAAGILISMRQFSDAESTDDKTKYGADLIFGSVGFLPGGPYISAFWFFGGRELVFQYGETMGELMKDGINPGYPVYQPFK